jgi:hypothetical protein
MSSDVTNEIVENFRNSIEIIISKHKPSANGEKGSIPYHADYLKNYGEKLSRCVIEITDKGSEIFKNFNEKKEGECKLLLEQLMREINQITEKFKSRYWR